MSRREYEDRAIRATWMPETAEMLVAGGVPAWWTEADQGLMDSVLVAAGREWLAAEGEGTLHDYATGEAIRPATAAEVEASRAAEESHIGGGAGVITVGGRSCYVA